ncbi:MAG: Na/Pi cotransporter family protein [Chromatiales bacterium]|nr:Na/Pi cotransporter family protein [Chromatiales bacterium]
MHIMNYGFSDILTLLGSLGLFLYGMKVMSDALMKLAGDNMRNILASTTSNRLYALLTGFVITAAIQSSSATTLMVISFVNASLLTLTEAVGVIMGANIGTTVTAWLITILGFKVKMSAIALPLMGAGFLLTLSKSNDRKNWGYFTVGFSLLFIGLQFLSESVPDISNNPLALEFLAEYTTHGYLSLLLFLAIGSILTLIIQSSSATMALTLLMTYEGWIPFDMAAAMVVGQNIGTTITAILAAFVANFNAKRAAMAHLIFNVIGSVWILILFYPFIEFIASIVENIEGDSPFVKAAAIPIALSLFHTIFNLLNTILLIGFVPLIVRTVERIIPTVIEAEVQIDEPMFLDDASIKYPQTAIKALTDESARLLENAAYKILAHGLRVHREDLESDRHLHDILESHELFTTHIDIDQIYSTKIKRIYSKILEYATELQSLFKLSEEEIETIRNLLVADRLLVQVVKRMKPLHKNIEYYIDTDNESIRKEYNALRHGILKVVREIKRIGPVENLPEHLEKLHQQRKKAKKLDVLLNGHIEELIPTGKITREMASSLINDSSNASRITKNLVDIATIIYKPKDTLISKIDDKNAQEYPGDAKINK